RRNRIWLQMVSHKALRLLGPALLAIVLATSGLLAGSLVYRMALGAQVAFYLAAAAGLIASRARRPAGLSAVPAAFVLLQAAAVIGMVRFFRHRQPAAW